MSAVAAELEVLLVCTGRDSHKPWQLGTYRRGQVPPWLAAVADNTEVLLAAFPELESVDGFGPAVDGQKRMLGHSAEGGWTWTFRCSRCRPVRNMQLRQSRLKMAVDALAAQPGFTGRVDLSKIPGC